MTLCQKSIAILRTCAKLALIWHALGNAQERDQQIEQALAAAKNSNAPEVLEYVYAVLKELNKVNPARTNR